MTYSAGHTCQQHSVHGNLPCWTHPTPDPRKRKGAIPGDTPGCASICATIRDQAAEGTQDGKRHEKASDAFTPAPLMEDFDQWEAGRSVKDRIKI